MAAGAVALAVAVVGLSPAAAPPAHAAQTITDIAYAPAQPAGTQGNLLDLYLPDGDGPAPLVIWTSGSAWLADNGKAGARSIAPELNARGYAVAGVSVRSSSQVQFPGQVHDIKAAIRWLRANADRYDLDPDRFAVMGDSSGGWVASMATLTGGVQALEGDLGTTGVSSRVQAGVAFYPPTDLLQIGAQAGPGGMDHDGPTAPGSLLLGCQALSCPDLARQANPVTHVDGDDPPLMLLHGQADGVVPHGQSVLLYEALKDRCVDTQFFSVPGAGHMVGEVMSPARFGQQTVSTVRGCQETRTTGSPNPSWDTIVGFLDAALGEGTPGPVPTTPPTEPPAPT
ncbi:esterase, partial [Cellulomonas bogoriensis 69B4 = DSM 16987]